MKNISRIKNMDIWYSVAWLIVYRLFLEILYVRIIQPDFFYYGFQLNPSIYRSILSWMLLFPVLFLAKRWENLNHISNSIVLILVYLAFIPATMLFAYMDAPFLFILTIYYMVLVFLTDRLPSLRLQTYGRLRSGLNIMIYMVLLILGVVELFIWARYTNFHIQMDLYNVYGTRLIARSFSMPLVLYYFHSWARIVAPFLAVYALHNRKVVTFVALLLLQFIVFSIDASKSVFFSLVLGVFLYFLFKKGGSFTRILPFGLACLTGGALIEYLLIGTKWMSNYIIRRITMVPALLNYYFYDFANNGGIDYYRQSLSFLGPSLYSKDIADLVGDAYFHAGMHANNGLFADAYMNLGIVGVVVMPLMIALMLKILDGSMRDVSPCVTYTIVIVMSFNFISSSFFTILLTHGFVIMCLLGYICQEQKLQLTELL